MDFQIDLLGNVGKHNKDIAKTEAESGSEKPFNIFTVNTKGPHMGGYKRSLSL